MKTGRCAEKETDFYNIMDAMEFWERSRLEEKVCSMIKVTIEVKTPYELVAEKNGIFNYCEKLFTPMTVFIAEQKLSGISNYLYTFTIIDTEQNVSLELCRTHCEITELYAEFFRIKYGWEVAITCQELEYDSRLKMTENMV